MMSMLMVSVVTWIILAVVLCVLVMVALIIPVNLWFRCLVSGTHVGMFKLVGMKLRRVNASMVVDAYINYIGEGLVNLANIFRPDAILIGGGISRERDYLTIPLQKKMDAEAYGGEHNPRVIVKAASLQNDAGILGAAALVINKE